MANGEAPVIRPGSETGTKIGAWISRFVPGIVVAITVALASKYLESVTPVPALMTALIIGLLLSGVIGGGDATAGLDFSGKHLLALGVALLGARLTLDDVTALGWKTAAVVVFSMAATLVTSWLAARILGLSRNTAILAGAGTAICGASAIIATSAALPKKESGDVDTALVIIAVVVISAASMLLYPLIATHLGLSQIEAGVVLGGSIHNVPQAVGAGYSLSEVAGNSATLTKLFRVALLGPLVIGVALLFGGANKGAGTKIGLPWFIIVFTALLLLGSFVKIPGNITSALNHLSSWLLLIAIAAIGLRTPIAAARTAGPRILVLVVINSIVLVTILMVAALLHIF
ncbi:MAG: putative sulfate exporter family transporter [Xanthobacteraceae bacterium]|nr:putative sulfate exporter family transporter [Xanthobacteraceae bacterium]